MVRVRAERRLAPPMQAVQHWIACLPVDAAIFFVLQARELLRHQHSVIPVQRIQIVDLVFIVLNSRRRYRMLLCRLAHVVIGNLICKAP